jgi:hypothetical protein
LDVIDAIYRDEEGKVRYHYVLIDLVAEYLGGELAVGSDIDEACWVTEEELPKFHLPERTLTVVLKALEKMGRILSLLLHLKSRTSIFGVPVAAHHDAVEGAYISRYPHFSQRYMMMSRRWLGVPLTGKVQGSFSGAQT